MPPGSSLHPAICPLCPLNVDLQRTIELATRAFFHAVYRPRKSLSQQNYHKDESQGTLGQIGFIFAGTLGAKLRGSRCCCSQPLKAAVSASWTAPTAARLAQRLQAPLSCVRQQLRAAPVDSASKKLGRADWCSGAKRAIQAPPRPNALLIQQRHTPGPCRGSV